MKVFGYKFDKDNIPIVRGLSKDRIFYYKGKTYVYGSATGLLKCAYESVTPGTEGFFIKALDHLQSKDAVEPYQALQEIAKNYYEIMNAHPWGMPESDKNKAILWWNVLGNKFYHLPLFEIASGIDKDLTPELYNAVNADVIEYYSFGLIFDIVLNEVRMIKQSRKNMERVKRGTVKQEVPEVTRPESTEGTDSPSTPIYDLNIKWGPDTGDGKRVRELDLKSFRNLPKGVHRLTLSYQNIIRLWAVMPEYGSGVMTRKELRSLDKEERWSLDKQQYLNEMYWLVSINGVCMKFWKYKKHYMANSRLLKAEELNKVVR